ncbi:MAG: hypothetical protein EOP06_28160 [Proteobacteria bacterium]|nr:MAG: hypothetical protein EOP06_28160 [Pseudomonadota bacterium]
MRIERAEGILPPLSGSDEQIPWATLIRAALLKKLSEDAVFVEIWHSHLVWCALRAITGADDKEDTLERLPPEQVARYRDKKARQETLAPRMIKALRDFYLLHKEAKWWIDNRNLLDGQFPQYRIFIDHDSSRHYARSVLVSYFDNSMSGMSPQADRLYFLV